MPCRSDKTRSGMARYAHLADGRLKLVLVRKCSPLQVGAVRCRAVQGGACRGRLAWASVSRCLLFSG